MKTNFIKSIIILFSFVFFLFTNIAISADLTSTNFIVRDPIVGTGGTKGSSSSFNLFSTGHNTLSGANSSTNFISRSGFLYFPFVDVGVLTALQNGVDVDLSWTISTAGLGFNVSGYKVGVSNVSGGPYSYTTLGLVTNYTYEDISPGYYCYIVETLDSFGNTIAKTNEDCITIDPIISFSISDNNLNFGNLSISGPRYANTSSGSATSTIAHTISIGSNADSGYVVTYNGSTLTSGSSTIDVASSVSGDGTPGTEQFGISLSTDGSAIIPMPYRQTGPTRTFVANTTTEIAATSGTTSSETLSLYYLANISSGTEAGEYKTNITYVATGEF